MPFHNPLWAKKRNPIRYLTLGLYPYTAKTTGSQTQVGSSSNTIKITFTNYDEDYWNGYERTIPAYTYFTLGSTALNASNVPAVSDPDTPILPHNVESVSGSNQRMEWQATFTSSSARKVYDESALTAPGLTITDMFAADKDTVWYSGANPVHLAFSIQKNEGTLTVIAVSNPDPPDPSIATVQATITPGTIRVGGSSFWATLTGYGNVDDADDESSNYVDFGSGNTNKGLGYFFKQELAGAQSLVMAGFTSDYNGMYATIAVGNSSYTTQITNESYNYYGYGHTSIGSVAAWSNADLWANLFTGSGAEIISISITSSNPSAT